MGAHLVPPVSANDPGGHKKGSLGRSRDYLEGSSSVVLVSLERVQEVLFLSWSIEKVLLISETVPG